MHSRIAHRDEAFLLIVDLQESLMKVMSDTDALLQNVEILIEVAKVLGLPLFATEQYPKRLGPTVERIRSRWGEITPYGKMAFSSCGNSELMEEILQSSRRQPILCGVEAHVCVNQTAHDLLEQGFTVHVPADAVASRTDLNRQLGLEKMRDSGAIITSTEMVAYELMGRAGTPEFKAMLPLFK